MPQEWRCCLNWRGLVRHVSKKEEWKLACVNVFTRVSKAVHFWPVFHLLTSTKPLTAWDQISPLGRRSSNEPADLPAPALLGMTAASTNHLPLSCFLRFFTLPLHALGCNMWGALLPKLLKSLSFYGHLYPKSSPCRGDRGRFITVPLPCLCLLRTLRPHAASYLLTGSYLQNYSTQELLLVPLLSPSCNSRWDILLLVHLRSEMCLCDGPKLTEICCFL